MNTNLFCIELIGGPVDGLQVQTSIIPGRMLRRYSSSGVRAEAGDDCLSNFRGDSAPCHLALYDLVNSRYRFDAGGLPLIEMKYEFVGTTAMRGRPTATSSGGKLLSAAWLRWLPAWLAGCRCRFAAWMTAPIDYPLRTRHIV